MSDHHFLTECRALYQFLKAARGSWRNAIYVVCNQCPYPHSVSCEDVLCIPESFGSPILIPVSTFETMTGEKIESSECITTISRADFQLLYSQFFVWHATDPSRCCILQAIAHQNTKLEINW